MIKPAGWTALQILPAEYEKSGFDLCAAGPVVKRIADPAASCSMQQDQFANDFGPSRTFRNSQAIEHCSADADCAEQ